MFRRRHSFRVLWFPFWIVLRHDMRETFPLPGSRFLLSHSEQSTVLGILSSITSFF